MSTVLILGGGGAIGASIAAEAVQHNHQVHVTLREGGNRSRVAALGGAQIHATDLADLTDHSGVSRLISQTEPELIVMSALPAGHPAIGDAARAAYVNDILRLQFALFKALKETASPARLVLIGSSTLYGAGQPRDPNGPIHPQNFRGVAKGCERLLAELLCLEQGRRLVELRVFSAYGRWMNPKRLLSRLLRAALAGTRVPLAEGPLPRDWIHHADIARAALASMNLPNDPGIPIVLNMCSGELVECRDVAQRLERVTGCELIAGDAYPPGDWMGDVLPGIPPSKDQLPGWSRTVSLDAGLADLWRWAQTDEGKRYVLEQGDAG